MKSTRILLSSVAALFLTLSLAAQTILIGPDTFDRGTPESHGYYSFNGNPAGTPWNVGGGELLNDDASAPNTLVFKSFPETTITRGESLTVKVSFRNEQILDPGGSLTLYVFDLASPVEANRFGGDDPADDRTGLGIAMELNNTALAAKWFPGNGSPPQTGTSETRKSGLYNTFPGSRYTPAPDLAGGGSLVEIILSYSIDSTGLLMEGTVGGAPLSYRIDGVTSFTGNALRLGGSWINGPGFRFSRFDDIEVSSSR